MLNNMKWQNSGITYFGGGGGSSGGTSTATSGGSPFTSTLGNLAGQVFSTLAEKQAAEAAEQARLDAEAA